MDIKVLQFQNRKLSERIEQRRRAEEDLRKRIEQLEQRQTTDDDVLCIVNRYWNQVNTRQVLSWSAGTFYFVLKYNIVKMSLNANAFGIVKKCYLGF